MNHTLNTKTSHARRRFLDYVRGGGDQPYVSLQIGAGAGFDARLAGREWNSEATLADTIAAYQRVGCDPLLNVAIPPFGQVFPPLAWEHQTEIVGNDRITQSHLETPFGPLQFKIHETKKTGATPMVYPLGADDPLDPVLWYADQHARAIDYIPDLLGPVLEEAQPHGAVSIQWNLQPFELFGLASVPDLVLQAMLNPTRYRQVCDRIREVNILLARKVIQCGADFVFLGGPGAEMLSPRLYEEYLVPDSQAISRAVHEAGGLIYSHVCSPVEPLLTMGYFNQMGIDLFETLSGPPVGNVADLAAARRILDPNICTRGNIGLDVLLNGSVEQVIEATQAVLRATAGTRHIVAASDYLFHDIPLENARAVVETVNKNC